MTLRRAVPAIPAAVAAVATLFAPAASQAATVDHFNDHGGVVYYNEYVPCVGPATQVSLDWNLMYHSSVNTNGAHEREVFTGTFEAVLEEGGTVAGRLTFADVADNTRSDGQYIVETNTWSGRILSGEGAGTQYIRTKGNWTQQFTGPIDDQGNWIEDHARAFFTQEHCH